MVSAEGNAEKIFITANNCVQVVFKLCPERTCPCTKRAGCNRQQQRRRAEPAPRFFQSLRTINAKVSDYAKVAGIIKLHQEIIAIYLRERRQLEHNPQLNRDEQKYLLEIFQNVVQECNEVISHLTAVITPGELEMKDDERLVRVDALYDQMQEHSNFIKGAVGEIKKLTLQRIKDYNDLRMNRVLRDIKNK